jgi:hypothetical protein
MDLPPAMRCSFASHFSKFSLQRDGLVSFKQSADRQAHLLLWLNWMCFLIEHQPGPSWSPESRVRSEGPRICILFADSLGLPAILSTSDLASPDQMWFGSVFFLVLVSRVASLENCCVIDFGLWTIIEMLPYTHCNGWGFLLMCSPLRKNPNSAWHSTPSESVSWFATQVSIHGSVPLHVYCKDRPLEIVATLNRTEQQKQKHIRKDLSPSDYHRNSPIKVLHGKADGSKPTEKQAREKGAGRRKRGFWIGADLRSRNSHSAKLLEDWAWSLMLIE